ncbi:MAG TPA: hypothetical protein VEX65_00505, partial [Flavisolibacter sp.]|nr:hypothetical protein [Flavisolibacter sp.]
MKLYFLKLTRPLIALLCVLAAMAVYYLNPFGVSAEARLVIAFAMLMIGLWVTEALPMPVVALLPLILFPFFGIAPIDVTAS